MAYQDRYEAITDAVERLGSINKAAAELGLARSTAQNWYRQAKNQPQEERLHNQATVDMDWPEIPSEEVPLEEVIERKKRRFKQLKRSKDTRQLIRVKVNSNKPIGLGVFGDPHCDDDGCDIEKLLHHADVVRETPGLYGINVGDNNNLWPGRLAIKYADQVTTASEGWMLTEHFIHRTRDWAALMKGNHDHFTGIGDPLDWIRRPVEAYQEPYNIRIALVFPNGKEFRFWLRHDFAGNSQWNGVHGMVKAAKFGAGMHLLIGGHRHSVGYHAEYDPHQDIYFHCLRTAGYKVYDDYAEKCQFEEANIYQCPVTIIDPDATNPADFAHVITDTERGADYLTFLRNRR